MSPILFLHALTRLLVRPRRTVYRQKTIAVLQPAKLGDMVCTTPVLRALRTSIPDARIIVLGDALNEALLLGSPDVDRYVRYTSSTLHATVAALQTEHIDVAIIATPCASCVALFALTGVRTIIAPKIENGYSPFETRSYRLLRRFVRTVPHRMRSYAPREYLRLLEPLGIHSSDTTKHVPVDLRAKKRADELLGHIPTGTKRVCFAVSAGNAVKEWPPERFAEVVRYLHEHYGTHSILIGAKGDRDRVMRVAALLETGTYTNLLEKTSMQELIAVIGKCDLFIGLDTGPIYIAEALGVPTVDITGPVDPNEQPPRGPRNLLVTPAEPFEPATFVMNSREYDSTRAQLLSLSIPVEAVTMAAGMLLEG
jgi:ADP-heptose:LPS heptosyltransferase